MAIDHKSREQVRICILRLCAQADRHGLSQDQVLQAVRSSGFRQVTAVEFAAQCDYLADQGLVAPAEKVLSPENRAWRITAKGSDWLAERNLDLE